MNKNTFESATKAVIASVYFIMPFAISGGLLVTIAYIIDFIFGSNPIYGLGSETSAAFIFKSLGTLTFSLMLPVLSAILAVKISEKGAFYAGLAGGFLSQNGATLMLAQGDTTAVSGFIGAIVAGFVAGFMYNAIKSLTVRLSTRYYTTLKSTVLPLCTVLVVGFFMLCINPTVSALNTGLSAILTVISNANPVAFGAVLGIMTAIDMGGTFSKAAYVFAAAAIASGEYTAMAAVVGAGMTVSLSIALSAVVFKPKFSKKEKELARANLIFGLCSITEGAIPFAAKNPTRVIPACTVGAAISGALSAGFGCTLIAPYGGIFVIPLVGNPLLFCISVFVGTITGAVFLGILKNEPKKLTVKS